MENTSIQEKKDFIKRMKKRGDITTLCKKLGYSETVYWSGMGRTDDRYTVAEMKIILAMYKEMLEREELVESFGLETEKYMNYVEP